MISYSLNNFEIFIQNKKKIVFDFKIIIKSLSSKYLIFIFINWYRFRLYKEKLNTFFSNFFSIEFSYVLLHDLYGRFLKLFS